MKATPRNSTWLCRCITRVRQALAIAAAIVLPSIAAAQSGKPYRIVNSFGPGGTGDTVARALAPLLEKRLNAPIIVEPRVGGGGNVAANVVVAAEPDGHTILMTSNAVAIEQVLKIKPPFDLQKDLRPLSLVLTGSFVLAVNSQLPVTNMREFIAYTKANPGRLHYSHAGGLQNLSWERFKSMSGLQLVGVPYKGAAQMMTSLLSNETQFTLMPADILLPHAQAGKIRLIMAASKQRNPLLPQVPSSDEVGMQGFECALWLGLFLPGKTPNDVVARLETAVAGALSEPALQQQLKTAGYVPGSMTAAEFRRHVDTDVKQMKATVEAAGIQRE
ncbi:MAG TPA: tripartite tricarboxylate transporter substrate-binding protein [Ramlibacter sp.]|nr:tripartite tricarboxylate transporter substrate-binding protein [Ramlibacter sp.]